MDDQTPARKMPQWKIEYAYPGLLAKPIPTGTREILLASEVLTLIEEAHDAIQVADFLSSTRYVEYVAQRLGASISDVRIVGITLVDS